MSEEEGSWEVLSRVLNVGEAVDLAETGWAGDVMEVDKNERLLFLPRTMEAAAAVVVVPGLILMCCGLLWRRAGGTSGCPGWARR